MKAFTYSRVSTQGQVEDGVGLEVQGRLCRDFCRKEGIEVVSEYADPGVPGTDFNRPALQGMLAAINDVDLIVASDGSRLWRDDLCRVLIQNEIRKAGKDTRLVDRPEYSLYVDQPHDYLINGLTDVLDAYERLVIAQRLRRARQEKARAGYQPSGPAAFGLRWVSTREGDKRQKTIEPDPDEAELVQMIFREYLRLGSVDRVSKHLEKEGLRNRKGKSFSPQSLLVILRNPVYRGQLRHGDVIMVGRHQSLVSSVVFGKVQAALTRNRRNRKREA